MLVASKAYPIVNYALSKIYVFEAGSSKFSTLKNNFQVFFSCLIFIIISLILPAFANSSGSCGLPSYSAEVVNTYPHDAGSFTQGLVYEQGKLYESSGQYGESAIRYYSIDLPVIPKIQELDKRYFAEGLAIVNDWLVQLTYQAEIGFVYNKKDLQLINQFSYSGQGWGLTYDGAYLIMSNGSAALAYLDTKDFTVKKTLEVKRCNQALSMLNELEYIDSMIFSNVWFKNIIVVIDPKTGKVVAEIDLGFIADKYKDNKKTDVLNGIAWDNDNRRLFITGKYWPHLYQIAVKELDIK